MKHWLLTIRGTHDQSDCNINWFGIHAVLLGNIWIGSRNQLGGYCVSIRTNMDTGRINFDHLLYDGEAKLVARRAGLIPALVVSKFNLVR